MCSSRESVTPREPGGRAEMMKWDDCEGEGDSESDGCWFRCEEASGKREVGMAEQWNEWGRNEEGDEKSKDVTWH